MESVASHEGALSDVLERYWGYASFRPLQREAMDGNPVRTRLARRAADRRRKVALLSGAGARTRRACGRRLAADLADEGSGRHARRQRRAGGLLQQLSRADEKAAIAAGLRGGRYRLLYVSPERLVGDGADASSRDRCDAHVSFVAIDEAHCISQWGHDFRPEYRQLGRLRSAAPEISLHAYTATATARVRNDIATQLGLWSRSNWSGSFDRPNLVYRVLRARQLEAAVARGPLHVTAARRASSIARLAARSTAWPHGSANRASARCLSRRAVPTTSAAETRMRSWKSAPT